MFLNNEINTENYNNLNTIIKYNRWKENVENKLHWQMDFTFKCDNNTTSNKKALFNLQIIKKNALNILNIVKEDYGKCSLKRIRFKVGMNP